MNVNMDNLDKHERFLSLLLRHEQDLRAFISALLPDAHEREDALQEAALALWRRFDDFDPNRSFGNWARGVAAKVVLNRRSSLSRRPLPLSLEAIDAVRKAFDQSDDSAQDRFDALRECLDTLPPRSREILAWRYEQNLKGAAIAERLQTSLDAVHKTLSRLRIALESCIQQRMRGEGGV